MSCSGTANSAEFGQHRQYVERSREAHTKRDDLHLLIQSGAEEVDPLMRFSEEAVQALCGEAREIVLTELHWHLEGLADEAHIGDE